MGILGDIAKRDLTGGIRKEDMIYIENCELLGKEKCTLLSNISATPFMFGGLASLRAIIDDCRVDVEARKGVDNCPIPKELLDLKNYWKEKLDECRERNGDCGEISRRYEETCNEISEWKKMLKLGEYISSEKKIVLYPDAMMQCDNVHFDQLLVSTFVHETMHAYFDRDGHEMYPYIPFIEEPLAEFGMLLFLKESGHKFYDWAYDNVKNKKTCYRFGAALMDRHIKEGQNSTIRQFLEQYKVYVAERPMCPTENVDGSIIVDAPQCGKNNANPVVVLPNWQNVFNYPPRYFYDAATNTLGLDGTWSRLDRLNIRQDVDIYIDIRIDIHHHGLDMVDNIYLGEHFDCEHPYDLDEILSYGKLIISSQNAKFKAINGIPVLKSNNKPFLDSCGDDCYEVCRNGKWGAVDGDLNGVIPFKYDCIWSFNEHGFCQVEVYGKYGLVDKQGKEIVPVLYDHINNFQNGFATMKDSHGRWGVIDCHGDIVVPCKFDNEVAFDKNGVAKVEKDSEEYFINTKGERVEIN